MPCSPQLLLEFADFFLTASVFLCLAAAEHGGQSPDMQGRQLEKQCVREVVPGGGGAEEERADGKLSHFLFFSSCKEKKNAKKAAGPFLCQAATSRELLGSLAAASLNSVTQCTCFLGISRLSPPSGRTFFRCFFSLHVSRPLGDISPANIQRSKKFVALADG